MKTRQLLKVIVLTLCFPIAGSAQYCDSNLYTIGCGTDEIASFYTTGGMTNISNINSGCDSYPLSYTYHPNKIHKAMAGAFVNFSIFNNLNFDEGFKIFVDWNNDFDFDDPGEDMFTTAIAPGMAASGSFQIPVGLSPGLRRLRVRCASAGSFQPVTNFAACDLLQYGEAEDYNLEIAPPCNAVTNLTLTSAGSNSASFSWTAASGVVGYQYATSVMSTFPATGTNITGVTQTVTSLNPNSSFYFFIRSKCNDSSYSNWSAMAFSTLPAMTGVNTVQAAGGIKVYPNPVKDRINIESVTPGRLKLDLYDIRGRHIANLYYSESKGSVSCALPEGTADGFYLLAIETETGREFIRIVVE
ncbi:MAG TPA: GEVED domain-containing protein [Flavipsychrobacter sp.]|nr:GEVED domain-containing protein [Flavipsychrobacter sp.]